MGSRSGGKILKRRRRPTTPYDRPDAPSKPSGSSGWLGGFFLPATRKIASGAGNFILSVFGSDGSSSSDSDSSLDDEVDDDSDNNDIDFQGAGELNKESAATAEILKCPSCGKLPFEQSDVKHQIKYLLLQETFTREESNDLIRSINLQTVEGPTIGEDVLDVHRKAVFEAKKWLEDKKSGSGLNAEQDNGVNMLSTSILPYASKVDVSPVDVARSYMQGRSLTSPLSRVDFSTPSPSSMFDFKQEQIHPFVGSSLVTSELKKDSCAMGSWNIEEEIRKVRSKAAEDILKNCPSTNVNLSSLSTEQDTSPCPLSTGDKDQEIDHNSEQMPEKHVEVTCELLSEQSLEVPIADETGGGGDDAEIGQEVDIRSPGGSTGVDMKQSSPPKSGGKLKQQQQQRGRKASRYYRKTRGKYD